MSYHLFHTYDVPFGFFEQHKYYFFQTWAILIIPLPNFDFWPCYKIGEHVKGQIIQGAQNIARLRTIPNTSDFFLPKNR